MDVWAHMIACNMLELDIDFLVGTLIVMLLNKSSQQKKWESNQKFTHQREPHLELTCSLSKVWAFFLVSLSISSSQGLLTVLTMLKTKAMSPHCLVRYKGAPLYPPRQCVHIASVFGLVSVIHPSIT